MKTRLVNEHFESRVDHQYRQFLRKKFAYQPVIVTDRHRTTLHYQLIALRLAVSDFVKVIKEEFRKLTW